MLCNSARVHLLSLQSVPKSSRHSHPPRKVGMPNYPNLVSVPTIMQTPCYRSQAHASRGTATLSHPLCLSCITNPTLCNLGGHAPHIITPLCGSGPGSLSREKSVTLFPLINKTLPWLKISLSLWPLSLTVLRTHLWRNTHFAKHIYVFS